MGSYLFGNYLAAEKQQYKFSCTSCMPTLPINSGIIGI